MSFLGNFFVGWWYCQHEGCLRICVYDVHVVYNIMLYAILVLFGLISTVTMTTVMVYYHLYTSVCYIFIIMLITFASLDIQWWRTYTHLNSVFRGLHKGNRDERIPITIIKHFEFRSKKNTHSETNSAHTQSLNWK